jgi:hypothetical protein
MLAAMAAATAGRADTPAEVVHKPFGKDVVAVRKTREAGDDIALARRMLARARTLQGRSDLVRTLCEQAYTLTSSLPDGAMTAIEAMDLLAERVRSRRQQALETMLALQKRLMAQAEGPVRTAHSVAVLRTLLKLGDLHARNGQASEAQAILDAADALARDLPPVAMRQVSRFQRILPDRLDAGKTAAELQKTLQADPDDTDTRTELVELYVVRLDDPQMAATYLRGDLDAALLSYVPLTGRHPDPLPAGACKEAADWLEHLAAEAPPTNEPALLQRARTFLNAYLKKTAGTDAGHPRAVDRLRHIDSRLAELGLETPGEGWSRNSATLGIVASADVRAAIAKARQALLNRQQPDGRWQDTPRAEGDDAPPAEQTTAVATYALIESGLSPRDPAIDRALRWLAAHPTDRTLALAMRCYLWRAVQTPLHGRYSAQLFSDTDRLVRATADGSYGPVANPDDRTRDGDALHTAYAHLGVACGAAGGAMVEESYWRRALMWWLRAQNRDGGWGLRGGQDSRHVPTVAAAASVLLCLEHVGRSRDEAIRHGGMQSAMRWVEAFYNNGKNSNPLHYLYAVARLGTALGMRKIGESDWYAWASRDLIRHQDNNGLWAPRGQPAEASTALGLLVLSYAQAGR